ncbi:hypothetical protein G6F35_014853 [Rhizopus arrhizus]|nr:hypothetical protein G6F35_014853 [Rhizopus arrhizus]
MPRELPFRAKESRVEQTRGRSLFRRDSWAHPTTGPVHAGRRAVVACRVHAVAAVRLGGHPAISADGSGVCRAHADQPDRVRAHDVRLASGRRPGERPARHHRARRHCRGQAPGVARRAHHRRRRLGSRDGRFTVCGLCAAERRGRHPVLGRVDRVRGDYLAACLVRACDVWAEPAARRDDG